MDAVSIIVIVLVVLVLLFAVLGYLGTRRRYEAEDRTLRERAREADRHLAAAHAEDKGWAREELEAAARRVHAERHGREPSVLVLVQVVDRPGVEQDEAVFDADGERLVLGRDAGGAWAART